MDMKWVFDFGKYRGKTIDNVCGLDMGYIYWCSANVEKFKNGIVSNPELKTELKRRYAEWKRKIDNHIEACCWESRIEC